MVAWAALGHKHTRAAAQLPGTVTTTDPSDQATSSINQKSFFHFQKTIPTSKIHIF
jgi:hypothetical protein